MPRWSTRSSSSSSKRRRLDDTLSDPQPERMAGSSAMPDDDGDEGSGGEAPESGMGALAQMQETAGLSADLSDSEDRSPSGLLPADGGDFPSWLAGKQSMLTADSDEEGDESSELLAALLLSKREQAPLGLGASAAPTPRAPPQMVSAEQLQQMRGRTGLCDSVSCDASGLPAACSVRPAPMASPPSSSSTLTMTAALPADPPPVQELPCSSLQSAATARSQARL